MKRDSRLLESIFDQASGRIRGQDTSEAVEASAFIEALLSIVRNPDLAVVLRTIPDSLAKRCGIVESAVAGNSSLEKQAGSLRTAVELLVGKNVKE